MPNWLMVGNKEIDFGQSVKYLVVTLDRKLSWVVHIEYKMIEETLFISFCVESGNQSLPI